MNICGHVCLPYEQCASVLQWVQEGGVHAQMYLCLLAAEALTHRDTHSDPRAFTEDKLVTFAESLM